MTTITQPSDPITVGAVRRALAAAATTQLNALAGNGYPPLDWTVEPAAHVTISLSGQAPRGEYRDDQMTGVLTTWAHLLGLTLDPEPVTGTTCYRGHLGSYAIEVWAVTNHDVFDTPTPGASRI